MLGYSRRARTLCCGISLFAVSAAWAAPARAQSQTLDPITIVATKTEERATDTLAAVSTIRHEDIDRLMPAQVQGMFFGVPGVSFQTRADDPGIAINIRGLQDFGRVAVVVDGARQNFQRTGHNADGLFYLDPEMIGGADVVRGPVANIYGSGAIGGIASFRTKDVEDVLRAGQRWGILTHGMVGSNNFQGMGSAFAAARGDKADVIVGGVYRERDDYRDGGGNRVVNSANDDASGLAKLTFRPAEGHEVKISGLTYETNFKNGTPNAANTATVYDSTVRNDIVTARWRYGRPEDRAFNFDVNVYWTDTITDQTKIAGTSNPASGNLGAARSFRIDTAGFDANNTSRFEFGSIRNALTIGGDGFRDKVEVVDPTGTGDLFTPNGERSVSGAFVQLKTDYTEWLQSIAALRYDNYNLSGGSASSNGDRISPKFTLGVTPVRWFTIYGTYAEGYRAPAITEAFVLGTHPNLGPGSNFDFLQNPLLKPEIGKNKEAGINIRGDNVWTAGDAVRIKANLFRNDVENFIEQEIVPFMSQGVGGVTCLSAAFFCIQYQNVPQARLEGTEFEGKYDAGAWFLNVSAAHVRGRNLTAGVPLLKIPTDQVASTLGWRFYDRRITFAVSHIWSDSKETSEIPPGSQPGTLALPPVGSYDVVNLYASYQQNEDILWSIAVDNLLDRQYARYTDVTTINSTIVPSPSPGLTVKGALKVRFGDTFYKG